MSQVDADPPGILFVCTGNVCRSPYMEFRLREMLATAKVSDVPLASAGTRALQGYPMADPLVERLGASGVDASGFRATSVTSAALQGAGAVVTATREHRSQVVRYGGNELAERTFTLAQLSRLLSVDAPQIEEADPTPGRTAVDALVSAALATRGRGSARRADDDDLDDPWRRSRRTYRRVADRIDVLLIPIAARLVVRA
ncbi:arsenate reductase/protein-tyrosine-phosphatase family protein [Microbacterium sp. NPDC055521]